MIPRSGGQQSWLFLLFLFKLWLISYCLIFHFHEHKHWQDSAPLPCFFFAVCCWCTHWYRLYLNVVQHWRMWWLLWPFWPTVALHLSMQPRLLLLIWPLYIDLLKWLSPVSLWFTWSEQPCVIHLLSQQEYLGLPWLQCRYFAMARICSMVSFDCVALFKVFVLLSTPVLCWGMSLFFHEGVFLWSLSVSLSLCYSEFLVGVWHMLSNVITHRAWDEWVICTIVLSQGVCT